MLSRQVQSQQTTDLPLIPVCSDYFSLEEVGSDDHTLKEFCTDHGLQTNKCNVFLELSHVKDTEISDVVLMEKVKLYTVCSCHPWHANLMLILELYFYYTGHQKAIHWSFCSASA